MRRSGFTLAEVLVALVVIGIVSAAVAPVLIRGARPHPADAAAAQVRDLLASARRVAVRRGASVDLELDTRNGRYQVRTGAAEEPQVVVTEGDLVLPQSVSYTPPAGLRRFTFDALGAGRGEPITVQGGGRSARVEIDRWTGEARATRE